MEEQGAPSLAQIEGAIGRAIAEVRGAADLAGRVDIGLSRILSEIAALLIAVDAVEKRLANTIGGVDAKIEAVHKSVGSVRELLDDIEGYEIRRRLPPEVQARRDKIDDWRRSTVATALIELFKLAGTIAAAYLAVRYGIKPAKAQDPATLTYIAESLPMDQIATVADATNAAATVAWWPTWAPWIFWPMVVAVIVSFCAEWPKQLWFKPSSAWQRADNDTQKIGLLAPLLMLLGGALGTPVYLYAGLLTSPLLAAVMGVATGLLSAPIRDLALSLPDTARKFVRQRAGVQDTQRIPRVESPPADDVDPPEIP